MNLVIIYLLEVEPVITKILIVKSLCTDLLNFSSLFPANQNVVVKDKNLKDFVHLDFFFT